MKAFNLFSITLQLEPETSKRFDRLMDFLEGQQQSEVDVLTERICESTRKLSSALKTGK
jgi:hypothetical protein